MGIASGPSWSSEGGVLKPKSFDPAQWARKCRIEAARAIHPTTKAFLLDLATQLEAVAGAPTVLDPDDSALQDAVADRLKVLAEKRGNLGGLEDDSGD
jgi:hypothetical protein